MNPGPKPSKPRVRHRPDVPFDQMRSGAIKYEHGFHQSNMDKAKAKAHAEEVVQKVLEKARS